MMSTVVRYFTQCNRNASRSSSLLIAIVRRLAWCLQQELLVLSKYLSGYLGAVNAELAQCVDSHLTKLSSAGTSKTVRILIVC